MTFLRAMGWLGLSGGAATLVAFLWVREPTQPTVPPWQTALANGTVIRLKNSRLPYSQPRDSYAEVATATEFTIPAPPELPTSNAIRNPEVNKPSIDTGQSVPPGDSSPTPIDPRTEPVIPGDAVDASSPKGTPASAVAHALKTTINPSEAPVPELPKVAPLPADSNAAQSLPSPREEPRLEPSETAPTAKPSDRPEPPEVKTPDRPEPTTSVPEKVDDLPASDLPHQGELPPPPPTQQAVETGVKEEQERTESTTEDVLLSTEASAPESSEAQPLAAPLSVKPAVKLSLPKDAKSVAEIIHRCRGSYQEIGGGYSSGLVCLQFADDGEQKQTIHVRAHVPSGRILLEWLDTRKAGRQIAFDGTQPEANLDVLVGPAEPKLLGKRLSLPPSHLLVRVSHQFPTTKIGIEAWISNLEMIAKANERDDTRWGTLELAEPVAKAKNMYRIRQSAPVENPESIGLPTGGHRDWFVDSELMLPTMVIDYDANGRETESLQLIDLTFDSTMTLESVQLGNY